MRRAGWGARTHARGEWQSVASHLVPGGGDDVSSGQTSPSRVTCWPVLSTASLSPSALLAKDLGCWLLTPECGVIAELPGRLGLWPEYSLLPPPGRWARGDSVLLKSMSRACTAAHLLFAGSLWRPEDRFVAPEGVRLAGNCPDCVRSVALRSPLLTSCLVSFSEDQLLPGHPERGGPGSRHERGRALGGAFRHLPGPHRVCGA